MAKGKGGKTGRPFKTGGKQKGMNMKPSGGTKMVGKGMKGKKTMTGKRDSDGDMC